MKLLLRLLSYTKKYSWLLIITMFCLIGITAMNLNRTLVQSEA